MVIENKFDSKEGRALANATQCATYEARTRKLYGDIPCSLLFTTRTGEHPLGDTRFAPVSYQKILRAFHTAKRDLCAAGKWAGASSTASDGYACFLLDSFLRHLEFMMPDEEVRNAFRALARKEKPIGVSKDWINNNKIAAHCAQELSSDMETWDHDSMKEELVTAGASGPELEAFDKIYEWGQLRGRCEFSKPKTPSVVIKIPTAGQEAQILCIQGRKLRFYWVHLIGSSQSGNVPGSHVGSKFPNAYELVNWYCQRLNKEFNWDLGVQNDKGGFQEPSRPLQEIANPIRLKAFLKILNQIADSALSGKLPIDTPCEIVR